MYAKYKNINKHKMRNQVVWFHMYTLNHYVFCKMVFCTPPGVEEGVHMASTVNCVHNGLWFYTVCQFGT